MCVKVSCLYIISYILLTLSFLACSLSFVAPFWVYYSEFQFKTQVYRPPPQLPVGYTGNPNDYNVIAEQPNSIAVKWRGLWALCFPDMKCVWFWENNFDYQNSLPDWYKVCQLVFAIGLCSLCLAVLIAGIHFCLCACEHAICWPVLIGSLIISGFIIIALALALFGGFGYKNKYFGFSFGEGRLAWAFYVGVAGDIAAFVSAVTFYCDGCRSVNSHHGYLAASTGKA